MQAPAIGKIGQVLRRHRGFAAAAGLAAVAVVLALAWDSNGGEASSASEGDSLPGAPPGGSLPWPDLGSEPRPLPPGPHDTIARVREGESVGLRRSPGGPVIARLGDRTEFGSSRSFWVARVRGGWFGVPVSQLPNGELGWIRDDRIKLELYETSYRVVADISARLLELRYGKRVLDRFEITVGGPGSPTPPGAYAVTDGLAGKGTGPYYGCCILALSGHQPNLPTDWLGGDRIAIHGTPGEIGVATSAGCLRASDPDMVSLFARVPLGAPVFIRN